MERGSQRLFVMCGLPFSGKSTLARALADQLDLVNIEVDRLHNELGQSPSDGRVTREQWIAAYRLGYVRLEAALREGWSAVFDAVSYRRLQRNRVRRVAETLGIPAVIVSLEVTSEEANGRRIRNRLTGERVDVPSEDFREVASGMQRPELDEPCIHYHPSEPINAWIERVARPLLTAAESREECIR